METTLEKVETEEIKVESKKLYTEENLNKSLDKVIKEEYGNAKLIKHLNDIFSKKGMNKNVVSCLLQNKKDIKSLTQEEKIAFVQGCYDVLEWDYLIPEKNFSPIVLNNYDGFFIEEPSVTAMHFSYFRKIDDENFGGYSSYKDIYQFYANALITYNQESQRAGTVVVKTIKKSVEITLKQTAVEDMVKLMLEGRYEEDQIILNVRFIRHTIPNFQFIPTLDEVIGDINIVPNYERGSKTRTVCECIDGWHRVNAIVKAVARYKRETGEWLTGGIFVKIVMRDLEDARRIVRQTFMRTDTDPQFINSLKDDDYKDFADILASKSKIFKGKVASFYEEYFISNTALTYNLVIADTIRKCCTDIPVNNKAEVKWVTDDMARIIDEIIDFVQARYYPDIEMMKTGSVLFHVNMMVGYIAIANIIREIKGFDKYEQLSDELYLLTEEDSLTLKLNDKRYSNKNIYDYFSKLIGGVVNGK